MAAETEDGVFAAVPDAFDIDGVGEVPDFFGSVYCIGVVGARDLALDILRSD